MTAGTIRGVTIPPGRESSRRPALEWVLATFPWLMKFAMAVLRRLPPTSRLRQRVLTEGFARVFAAVNRGDPWPVPIGYEPDCEIHLATGFTTLGLQTVYHAHSGWDVMIEAVREPLPDVRWVPEHLIDLGDRLVVRLGMFATGRSSGAYAEQTWGSVYDLSARGRIKRQVIYWTWEETLAAAALREG